MRQSRRMSLIEAVANVAVGFALALLTQIIVFPLFDLAVTIGENLVIGSIFTAISICRSFALRRVFEAIRVRGAVQEAHTSGRLVLHADGSIDAAASDARPAQATDRRMPLTATPTPPTRPALAPSPSCSMAGLAD